MSDFTHKEAERLSPQQAAERLIDIAYALTAGGPIELDANGRCFTVPIAGKLLELEVDLSWSTPSD